MSRRLNIDRRAALQACPARAPAVRKEKKDGKLYVTVEFERPSWQRMLGAERLCKRTFGLDAYGREVYAYCNGKRPVEQIVRRFARSHNLSLAEAETAVTTFLKTLTAKGLVGIVVPRTDEE